MYHMLRRFTVLKTFAIGFFLIVCCHHSGFSAPIVDLPWTGQETCYDALDPWGEIPCAGTGQDGEYRMGVPWPSPRFTVIHCDASGQCPDPNIDCDGDASNDVVRDGLTGLTWTRDGNLPNGKLVWEASIDFAETLSVCGFTDWHVPNVNEIHSLFNAGTANVDLWLEEQGFRNIRWDDCYWTGTTRAAQPDSAFVACLRPGGQVGSYGKTSGTQYTWAVRDTTSPPAAVWRTGQTVRYREGDDGDLRRGVPWPEPRFTTKDDCVVDNLTGLQWAKDANRMGGPALWKDALNFARNLTLCGQSDWRLPNRKELFSLIDRSQAGNRMLPEGHPFDNVQNYYWLASTRSDASEYAGVIGLVMGNDTVARKDSTGIYAWPVRMGGPVGTVGTEFTIQGAGFGTKKGKVLIGKTALKIQDWQDNQIRCLVKKPLPPEIYSVTIRPQPFKSSPAISSRAFSYVNPELSTMAPDRGKTGTEVEISGQFFGTKKGKVYLEDPTSKKRKACKILEWTMYDTANGYSRLRFVVPTIPTDFEPGPYTLTVMNRVGSVSTVFTIE